MYNFQSVFLNQQQTLTDQQKSYLSTLFANYNNIITHQQQGIPQSFNYSQNSQTGQNPFSYWLEKKKALDSKGKNSIYRKGKY